MKNTGPCEKSTGHGSGSNEFRTECDQCSAKADDSFWQLASVVNMEGGEPHTSNLCQKCYKETLKAKG